MAGCTGGLDAAVSAFGRSSDTDSSDTTADDTATARDAPLEQTSRDPATPAAPAASAQADSPPEEAPRAPTVPTPPPAEDAEEPAPSTPTPPPPAPAEDESTDAASTASASEDPAVDEAEESTSASTTSTPVTAVDTRPPPPVDMAAFTGISPGQVNLQWRAPSDYDLTQVVGYAIYRATSPDDAGTRVSTLSVAPDELTTSFGYADLTASPGATYYYNVRTLTATDESEPSTTAFAVSAPDLPPLPTPELGTLALVASGALAFVLVQRRRS